MQNLAGLGIGALVQRGRLVRSLAADPSKEPTTCKVCMDWL